MTAPMVSSRAARITTRREFLGRTAAFTGAVLLSPRLLPAAETPPARTAVDRDPAGSGHDTTTCLLVNEIQAQMYVPLL